MEDPQASVPDAASTPTRRRPLAYQLGGQTLTNGWFVERLIDAPIDDPDLTGGMFSAQYVVRNGEKRAFLKALDFSHAPAAHPDNPMAALAIAAEAYAFEKQLLELCGSCSRIVHKLADGLYYPYPSEPSVYVPYIIFELAESDVRQHLDRNGVDPHWCLQAAHDLTVGMNQLHMKDVAHQDFKASNALVFADEGCKVGDVGSASLLGHTNNTEDDFAGCWLYAPPESWYGAPPVEWRDRRFAADLYLLGSVIVYMFTQLPMTTLLLNKHVAAEHRPRRDGGLWTGTYESALPYLQHAFTGALAEIFDHLPVATNSNYDYRADVLGVIRDLCNPDCSIRGTRLSSGERTFDLGRVATRLDLTVKRLRVRRSVATSGN